MATDRRYHVVNWNGGWELVREGSHEAIVTSTNRDYVMIAADGLLKSGDVVVYLHDERGRVVRKIRR